MANQSSSYCQFLPVSDKNSLLEKSRDLYWGFELAYFGSFRLRFSSKLQHGSHKHLPSFSTDVATHH